MQFYEDFYLTRENGSKRSTETIIPIVMELVQSKSVIDVGVVSEHSYRFSQDMMFRRFWG
jgi:hypothetical protein